MQSDNFGSAVTGFVSSIGLGKVLGIITFGDFTQTLVLGAIGGVGGWLGKLMVVHIVKTIKTKINKQKK